MSYCNKRKILYWISIYIIAICLILSNGCVYTHFPHSGHLDGIITYAPIGIIFILLVLKRHITQRSIITSLLITGYLCVLLIVSDANLKMGILEIITLDSFILYIYAYEYNKKPYLLIAYRNIIYYIALLSIIMWILCSVIKIIPNMGISYSIWGTQTHELKNYFYIYFERDRQWLFGNLYVCNRSIFVERSFAAFSFLIGWIYELFIENNPSYIRRIIFAIAMFSTLSMTALIIMLITYAINYVFKKENVTLLVLVKIFIIPLICIIVYAGISLLIKTKMSTGHSYSSRMSDLINGFIAWKKSPLYGYGYGNTDRIQYLFKTGYSNSISAILTQGGMLLMVMYIFPLFKGIIGCFRKKEIRRISFIIIFVITISVTAVAFRNTTIYVILYIGLLIDANVKNISNTNKY